LWFCDSIISEKGGVIVFYLKKLETLVK
jgi:hypothetical protein